MRQFIAFFAALTLFVACCAEDDIIDIEAGRILGVRDAAADLRTWKGVPFGEPTGPARRFQAPVAKAAWPGVLNCTAFGPGCYSDHHNVDTAPIQSEDCLNLNLYVPLAASLQVSTRCDCIACRLLPVACRSTVWCGRYGR